jgi:hypothetical protein
MTLIIKSKWHHFGTKTYRYLFLFVLISLLSWSKVKVNRLSISGRSLHAKWRHWHLNSRDGVFQNGDRFQVLTDFNGREDTYFAFKSWGFFFTFFCLQTQSKQHDKEVSFYNHTISCIYMLMLSIGLMFSVLFQTC